MRWRAETLLALSRKHLWQPQSINKKLIYQRQITLADIDFANISVAHLPIEGSSSKIKTVQHIVNASKNVIIFGDSEGKIYIKSGKGYMKSDKICIDL